MNKNLILMVLIATMSLSGCALFKQKPDVPPVIDTKKTVQIDKRLLQECPDLVEIKGPPIEETILMASEDWISKYKQCRAWKHELNDTVKKAFNVQ